MLAEAGRTRPHIGRKAFGQATLILLVDAACGEHALARREHDIHRGVLGEQLAWCQWNAGERRRDHRPAATAGYEGTAAVQRF